MNYDRDLGVVVASGHVEVSQDDRVLNADTLTYNERQKTVSASGNVTLRDATGNTVFADYMQVSDDLKNGVIQQIKMLLTDKSRIAAVTAKRTGPIDRMERGVYSPCKPCERDPMAPTTWQLRAERIVHDNTSHMIEYHNAWMDILGLPVLYTPYFSHPDPSVKRKSGFLPPSIGGSSNLGLRFQIPYYWVTGPSSDLTVEPIIVTKAAPVMTGRYRQRVENGSFAIEGSATYSNLAELSGGIDGQNKFEGHVFSSGRFDLTDNWRWGFDILRTTDKGYLQLYGFPHSYDRSLNSEIYGEGFDGRSYASVQAWTFQGLGITDHDNQQPIVAPLLSYNFVGEPNKFGAYWSLDLNATALSRITGRDDQRLSGTLGWTLPYTAPAGDIYKLSATMRVDGYSVQGFNPLLPNVVAPTFGAESGFTGRVFPQVSMEWRYPFVRRSGSTSQTIEPIVSADIAPSAGNNSLIPNEDSLDFQFDETNIFDPDRFTGLDLVDNGQRLNYGVKWSAYGDGGGHTSVLIGQSYQFNANNAFDVGAGLTSGFSDVVGAINVSPSDLLNLLYRFRIETKTMSFRRNEFGIQAGVPAFNVGLDYAFLDGSINDGSTVGNQQEFYGIVQSRINDNWSVFARGRQDLETDLTLEWGGGVTYRNDCISLQLVGLRTNYSTTNISPDTRVMLIVGFKNLGNYGFSF